MRSYLLFKNTNIKYYIIALLLVGISGNAGENSPSSHQNRLAPLQGNIRTEDVRKLIVTESGVVEFVPKTKRSFEWRISSALGNKFVIARATAGEPLFLVVEPKHDAKLKTTAVFDQATRWNYYLGRGIALSVDDAKGGELFLNDSAKLGDVPYVFDIEPDSK